MDINLTGKRALVCGSSQGIGKACAIELASLGASITLFSRNKAALSQVLTELDQTQGQQHHVLVADFSNPDEVTREINNHMAQTGGFEILLNNTGGPAPGPAASTDSSAFLAAFNLHLISNHHLVQALIPAMKEKKYGRIINVISTSVKQPLDNLGVSNTVRGAVGNWAKTLANELGPFGITVNNILPGATATERLTSIIDNKASKTGKSKEDVSNAMVGAIPAGRFCEPEEHAYAATFLASEKAAYINGTNVVIDGGRTKCL